MFSFDFFLISFPLMMIIIVIIMMVIVTIKINY